MRGGGGGGEIDTFIEFLEDEDSRHTEKNLLFFYKLIAAETT